MTAETESAATDNTTAAETTTAAATSSTESTDQKEAPQQTETTTEAETAEGAPEAYADFTLPEGMEVDTGLLAEVTPLFKEDGLTQERAQRYIDKYAARIQAMSEGAGEAFDKAYTDRKQAETAELSDKWLDAAKGDKEIGGDKFDAVKSRVMEAVGTVATPEMRQAFDELGWGNHPELIRFAHRLIDYTPQDKGERPAGAGGTEVDARERWYPDLVKK